jgi:hypothetical protein
MTLAVVGIGLVTPFAFTPSQHVFFLRANVPAPPPSPFERKDNGERVDVYYCTWLGSAVPIEQRLARLGARVLDDARVSFGSLFEKKHTRIVLGVSRSRAGLSEAALEPLARAAAEHGAVTRCSGDAGVFAGLRDAKNLLKTGDARVVVALAVDSFVALEAVEDHVRHPPSEWDLEAPALSEGAAALALMEPYVARREGIPILGTMEGCAVAAGASNDENDDLVDGVALTVAMREMPGRERVRSAFGPLKVDLLRSNEWRLTSNRLSDRFAPASVFTCLESKVGRLGAASGLANAVYGLATLRHRACDRLDASEAPFFAWAISPDGTRGIAMLTAREP